MDVVFDGGAMKRLREERHLTQEEVANRSGLAQSSISRSEKGSVPGVKFLKRLAPALDITFDQLVSTCFVEVADDEGEVA